MQPHFMDKFKNYEIVFSGLKNGKHEFRFEIDKAFFQLFDTEQEFTNPKITVHVLMERHSTFLELWIRIQGTVQLLCDISSQEFDHPVENEISVLVKFGEEYDDSDVDVITIPSTDHAVNVAQLIYEDVMLSIPMKKVSPNLSEEQLALLDQYMPAEPDEEEKETEVDPRWAALNKLKDKN